jgi:hypothetical protein
MESIQLLPYLTVVAFALLFPQDTANISTWLYLQARLVSLNAFMFVRAYWMYLHLRKDFASMGLAIPPFRFTPLWERN